MAVLALAGATTAGAASGAAASSPSTTPSSGGAGMGLPAPVSTPAAPPSPPTPAVVPVLHPTVPGVTAEIVNGLAYAPADAPIQVQRAIWAGDRIRFKPYVYAGGHQKWNDVGYDCSGSVSYVLHAAGLLKVSKDSSDFLTWGQSGLGQWITIYTNPGHAFVEIAGIRLDTSAEGDPHPVSGSGPRWRAVMTSTPGYVSRHPLGF